MSDIPEAVELLPCPKCGTPVTAMWYCGPGCDRRFDCYAGGESEHFHRRCHRCQYSWRTEDVLNAKVVRQG